MDDTLKPKKEVEKAQNNKTSSSYESRGNGEKMVINACLYEKKKEIYIHRLFLQKNGV